MGPERAEKGPDGSWLQAAAGLARGADRVLTLFLKFFLVMLLLYACFSLWDTWRIYDEAGIDEELLKYKPSLDSDGSEASFAELRKINPDVCAWLTLEGTHIDYPVVQGTDNIKYVNTNVYGEFSLSGSIFLDYRNDRNFGDSYSLIYGHHMEGEVMFGELANFTGQEYFESHQTGVLYLPDCTYQIEIFSCLQTDAYDRQAFGPGALTGEEMDAFLMRLRESSLQYREIGVTGQDRILALSTCSDAATNARTLIFGRLREISVRKGGALEE